AEAFPGGGGAVEAVAVFERMGAAAEGLLRLAGQAVGRGGARPFARSLVPPRQGEGGACRRAGGAEAAHRRVVVGELQPRLAGLHPEPFRLGAARAGEESPLLVAGPAPAARRFRQIPFLLPAGRGLRPFTRAFKKADLAGAGLPLHAGLAVERQRIAQAAEQLEQGSLAGGDAELRPAFERARPVFARLVGPRQRLGLLVAAGGAAEALGGLAEMAARQEEIPLRLPRFRRRGRLEQMGQPLDRVAFEPAAEVLAGPERMRFRAFVHRQMAARPGDPHVQVLQEALEAGLFVESGGLLRRAHEALDQILVRRQELPQDDGVELQPLGFADVEDARGVQALPQALRLLVVESEHGATRTETADGFERLVLARPDLDRQRSLDRRLFRLVLFRAAEDLAAEQEKGVGEIDQRADAAQIAPQAEHRRHALAVRRLASQPPHLGPTESAGIDDLLRVAGEQHAAQARPPRQGEDERHLELGQILHLVADHHVPQALLAAAQLMERAAAEVDAVRAPFRGEQLLIALGDAVDLRPFLDEQRRALLAEIEVGLLAQHRLRRREAGSLENAAQLLPDERRIERFAAARARRGAALLAEPVAEQRLGHRPRLMLAQIARDQ